MATVSKSIHSRGERTSREADEFHPSMARLLAPGGVLLLLTIIWATYLYFFGFSKGSESTTREYALYWYPMLAINLFVLFPAVFLFILRLATHRCPECVNQRAATGTVTPDHELKHHWVYFSLLLAAVIGGIGGWAIVFGADASWHQSAFRDTTITPVHIFSFYGFAPLAVLTLLSSYAYARTRLPEVFGPRRGLPLAFVILAAGGFFAIVNFAFNEFGHAMWIYEELFTYPMHWPFVVFITLMALVFASVAVMPLRRVVELLDTSGQRHDDAESTRSAAEN